MPKISYAISAVLFIIVIAVCSLVALETITTFSGGRFESFIKYVRTGMLVLPVIIVATMLLGNRKYTKINSIFYTVAIFWVPVLIYLFVSSIVLTVILTISIFLGVFLPLHILLVTTFIILGVVMVFGIKNALNPKIITHNLQIPDLAKFWGDKKIVLISDVHLGMVRREKFLEKIVKMINNENPDLVVIAGDLLDGPVINYEKALSPLGNIKSTHGTYYTAGNHDEYNRDQNKYHTELSKHVTILNDEKIIINETEIIGIVYAHENKNKTALRLKNIGYEKSERPSIAILHDPKNAEALADAGISLVLSGHTHSGQFFPISIFVKALYKEKTKGHYKLGETSGFTSVGVGTAGPLFRLGTEPEIVVLKISD